MLADIVFRALKAAKPQEDTRRVLHLGDKEVAVRDSAAEAKNAYLRSWRFALDALATLPLEAVAHVAGSRRVGLFRLNRVLRLHRLRAWSRPLRRGLDRAGCIRSAGGMRMWVLFAYMFLASHWLGAGFFFIAYEGALGGSQDSWATADGLFAVRPANASIAEAPTPGSHGWIITMTATPWEQLNRALYWGVVTAVTVGMGDIVPNASSLAETWWTMLTMYCGVTITCAAVANLTAMVAALDGPQAAHDRDTDAVERFMHARQLPAPLRSRVRAFLEHTWRSTRGVSEEAIVRVLPPALRAEVSGLLAAQMLRQVPVLSAASSSLVAALLPRLVRVVAAPGTLLASPRARLAGVHLLAQGAVQEREGGATGPLLRELGPGRVIGPPTALIRAAASPHALVAATYCDLWFLSAAALGDALAQHPDREEVRRLRRLARRLATAKPFASSETAPVDTNTSRLGPLAGATAEPAPVPAMAVVPADEWEHNATADAARSERAVPMRVRAPTLPTISKATRSRQQHGQGADTSNGHHPATTAFSRRTLVARAARRRISSGLPWWHPESPFRAGWGMCRFLAVAWQAFSVPAAAAFAIRTSDDFPPLIVLVYVVSYSCDIILLTDMVLTARYLAEREQGALVTAPDRLWARYRKRSFPIDLVAALPLELFAIGRGRAALGLLRLNKLIRVVRLRSLLRDAERIVARARGKEPGPAPRRLLRVFFLVLVAAWVVGAVWLFTADATTHLLGYASSWAEADATNPSRNMSHAGLAPLVRAVYWVLVATSTVGYGDIVPQNPVDTACATICILFGGLVYPAVVGAMAALLASVDEAARDHERVSSMLSAFMKRARFPHQATQRVYRYLSYARSRGAGDELRALALLPPALRAEAMEAVAGSALRHAPFLASVSPDVMRLLHAALEPAVFAPAEAAARALARAEQMQRTQDAEGSQNEATPPSILGAVMTRAGDVAERCLLLHRGSAVVMNDDNCAIAVAYSGALCGVGGLLPGARMEFTVVPLTYCDCLSLSRQALDSATESLGQDARSTLRQAIFDFIRDQRRLLRSRPDDGHCHRSVHAVVGSRSSSQGSPQRSASERRAVAAHAHDVPLAQSDFFHPASVRHGAWEATVLSALVLLLVLIPLRVAFPLPFATLAIEWVVDCILVADTVLRATRFAFVRDGWLVYRPEDVFAAYCSSSERWLDALALFPYEVVSLPVAAALGFSTWEGLAVLAAGRVPKLLHMRLLPSLVTSLSSRTASVFPSAPARLARLLVGVLLVCHIAACGFYAMARFATVERSCGGLSTAGAVNGTSVLSPFKLTPYADCKWSKTWLQLQSLENLLPSDLSTEASRYVRALNWSLPTLVVVVIGDVTPVTLAETAYVLVCILCGLIVNAAVIGSIANLVAGIGSPRAVWRSKRDALDKWIGIHECPSSLRQRATAQLDLRWEVDGSGDEEEALEMLPPAMRASAARHARGYLLRACPSFEGLHNVVISHLAARMTRQLCTPGDTLAHAGAVPLEAFFVASGSLQLLRPRDGAGFVKVRAGQSACVLPALLSPPDALPYSVACFDAGVVYTLSRSTFQDALARFPEPPALGEIRLPRIDRMRNAAERDEAVISRRAKKEGSPRGSASRGNDIPLRRSATSDVALGARFLSEMGLALTASDAQAVPHWVVPASRFRRVWSLTMSALLLWVGWSVPFRVAVCPSTDTWTGWYTLLSVVDWIVDALLVIDAVLRWTKFPAVTSSGTMWRPRELWARAIRGPFWVDVVALAPLDAVFLLFTFDPAVLSAVRLARLLCLRHLPIQAELVAGWLGSVGDNARRLLGAALAYFTLQHYAGCGWMAVHRYFERDQAVTWAVVDGLATFDPSTGQHNVCDAGAWHCYSRAIYFALTVISTVGYGDIRPYGVTETVYQLVVVLSGASLFAGVIGTFQAIFVQADETGRPALRARLNALRRFAAARRLPSRVRKAAAQHIQTHWTRDRGVAATDVLQPLSSALQGELARHAHARLFLRAPCLRACPWAAQLAVARRLRPLFCFPGEALFRPGQPADAIFFVAAGLLRAVPHGHAAVALPVSRRHAAEPAVLHKPKEATSPKPTPASHTSSPATWGALSTAGAASTTAVPPPVIELGSLADLESLLPQRGGADGDVPTGVGALASLAHESQRGGGSAIVRRLSRAVSRRRSHISADSDSGAHENSGSGQRAGDGRAAGDCGGSPPPEHGGARLSGEGSESQKPAPMDQPPPPKPASSSAQVRSRRDDDDGCSPCAATRAAAPTSTSGSTQPASSERGPNKSEIRASDVNQQAQAASLHTDELRARSLRSVTALVRAASHTSARGVRVPDDTVVLAGGHADGSRRALAGDDEAAVMDAPDGAVLLKPADASEVASAVPTGAAVAAWLDEESDTEAVAVSETATAEASPTPVVVAVAGVRVRVASEDDASEGASAPAGADDEDDEGDGGSSPTSDAAVAESVAAGPKSSAAAEPPASVSSTRGTEHPSPRRGPVLGSRTIGRGQATWVARGDTIRLPVSAGLERIVRRTGGSLLGGAAGGGTATRLAGGAGPGGDEGAGSSAVLYRPGAHFGEEALVTVHAERHDEEVRRRAGRGPLPAGDLVGTVRAVRADEVTGVETAELLVLSLDGVREVLAGLVRTEARAFLAALGKRGRRLEDLFDD